jgi:hypothetical protein
MEDLGGHGGRETSAFPLTLRGAGAPVSTEDDDLGATPPAMTGIPLPSDVTPGNWPGGPKRDQTPRYVTTAAALVSLV